MGTKGVPFGYLEFSRAIREKPYPHMQTAASGGGRLASAWFGFPTRSGSHGYELCGACPLRHPDPNRPAQWLSIAADSWAGLLRLKRTVGQRLTNCWGNGSNRTVATVRLGSDPFTPPRAPKVKHTSNNRSKKVHSELLNKFSAF